MQKFCLDALVANHADYAKQTNDIRKEMNKLNLKFKRVKSKQERKDLYGEYKMLKRDLKSIEQLHINDVFHR